MELSVEVHEDGAVEVWTLQGEARRNALSRNLVAELELGIAAADASRSLRVVVITGAGDRAFCAGADLKERQEMNQEEVRTFLLHLRTVFSAIERSPRIFVAAINGAALGGGAELALACDLRVIDRNAELALTETRLAIIPGAGGTQRLARVAGMGVAKDLILTGRRVPAEEAVDLRICHRLAEAGQAVDRAVELAREVAAGGPVALAAAKQAIQEGLDLPLERGLDLESEQYERTLGTTDRLEGLAAFREKRRAVYRGE